MTQVSRESLYAKIKQVLANPEMRLRLQSLGSAEPWVVILAVNAPEIPQLPTETVITFHCVKKDSSGLALAGAGDVGAHPGHGFLNGGDDGVAEDVSDLPLVVGGLNGFAGGKLDVELSRCGADDGDGELDHPGSEPQSAAEAQA